jgi:tetratricopeptide (TPR) repeat protein
LEQDGFFYWDCRSYLPTLGLIFILAELMRVFLINPNQKKKLGLIIVYLLVLGFVTIYKIGLYRDAYVFWNAVKTDYPFRDLPYIGLYRYYHNQHDLANAENYLLQAIEKDPYKLSNRELLFNLYVQYKNFDKAYMSLRKSLDYFPSNQEFIIRKYVDLSLEKNNLLPIKLLIAEYYEERDTLMKIRKVLLEKNNLMQSQELQVEELSGIIKNIDIAIYR